MATVEGWVGIAEVAGPPTADQEFNLSLGRREGLSCSPGGMIAAIQALGSGRVGEEQRRGRLGAPLIEWDENELGRAGIQE